MTLSIQSLIKARASVNHFQPDRPLDDDVIETLVRQATQAPSAYNLQNWRFIAARSAQAKARLQSAAFGQAKVAQASVAHETHPTLQCDEAIRSASLSAMTLMLVGYLGNTSSR